MDINTPALFFGAISLLLLAYTNRFFAIAKLIRDLNDKKDNACHKEIIIAQMPILRHRLQLIKAMQSFGVLSFILCTMAIFAIFLQESFLAELFFVVSVVILLISLSFGLWEIFVSTKALDIILKDTIDYKKD